MIGAHCFKFLTQALTPYATGEAEFQIAKGYIDADHILEGHALTKLRTSVS